MLKSKETINGLITIVFAIVTIIMFLVFIVMLLFKLAGHSSDLTDILVFGIGSILSLQIFIVSVLFPMKGDIGELKEFKKNIIEFQRQTIVEIKKLRDKI